jgi:hypothetical protein
MKKHLTIKEGDSTGMKTTRHKKISENMRPIRLANAFRRGRVKKFDEAALERHKEIYLAKHSIDCFDWRGGYIGSKANTTISCEPVMNREKQRHYMSIQLSRELEGTHASKLEFEKMLDKLFEEL